LPFLSPGLSFNRNLAGLAL